MKMIFNLTLTCLFVAFSVVPGFAQESQGEKSPRVTAPRNFDALQMAVQKICPVSGHDLGAMGQPVKVQAGEQTVFLCCQGCQSKQIKPEHWKAIQVRQAKAQGICPIMEKEVDAGMQATAVLGFPIFVCCPPCIPKIEAAPEQAVAKVRASYAAFIEAERQAANEQWHIEAQGICPVSGEALGSKGRPVKVEVGDGEHAFLCCQACTGKPINAKHWMQVQANLAKAQQICPVMEQPVDATMESVVVNGRKIFVCCPPCIAKIKADPETYVEKLNLQIADQSQGNTAKRR